MPRLNSANVTDFKRLDAPGMDPGYLHPVDRRAGVIPMAFQVTSPLDNRVLLLPHALVMHLNPSSFNETFTKKTETIQTQGGMVEQHWGDELSEVACDGSTGAFINLYTGLTSVMRRDTIAWDRFRDLYDLYHNNGSVYDPFGKIVLQGQIMMLYDRGTYLGTFRNFSYEETDTAPFSFTFSFSFKVEQVVYKMPVRGAAVGKPLTKGKTPGMNLATTEHERLPRPPSDLSDARARLDVQNKLDEAARRFDASDASVFPTLPDKQAKPGTGSKAPSNAKPSGTLGPAKPRTKTSNDFDVD